MKKILFSIIAIIVSVQVAFCQSSNFDYILSAIDQDTSDYDDFGYTESQKKMLIGLSNYLYKSDNAEYGDEYLGKSPYGFVIYCDTIDKYKIIQYTVIDSYLINGETYFIYHKEFIEDFSEFGGSLRRTYVETYTTEPFTKVVVDSKETLRGYAYIYTFYRDYKQLLTPHEKQFFIKHGLVKSSYNLHEANRYTDTYRAYYED